MSAFLQSFLLLLLLLPVSLGRAKRSSDCEDVEDCTEMKMNDLCHEWKCRREGRQEDGNCEQQPVSDGTACYARDDCASLSPGKCKKGKCECADVLSNPRMTSPTTTTTAATTPRSNLATNQPTPTSAPHATFAPVGSASAGANRFSGSAEVGGVEGAVDVSDVIQMADDEDESSSGRGGGGRGTLPSAAVAGIVIGAILALALLAFAVWHWHKNKRSSPHVMALSKTAMSDISSTRDHADADADADVASPAASAVHPATTRAPVQMYGPVNPENARHQQNGSAPQLLRGAALYDAPPKGFGVNDPSVSKKSGKSHYETVHDPLVR